MAAEAAISTVVELLADLLIKKMKSLQGVEGKVESLKEELEWMQSFLNEANKKQGQDEGVRNWIKKVREVAQDAEDMVEMFIVTVDNEKKRGLLRRCTGFAKRMHRLDRIGDEIDSIRARLDAIDKSRDRYGIKEAATAADSTRGRSEVELRRRLAPWQKDEHLVGIEDDVKKLLRDAILDEEKRGLSVAVVEGMGGIGKSTLAREIYNHSGVVADDRFECRGWVVVSSEFRPVETMKQLILELPGSDKQKLRELEENTKDQLYLQRKLQEMLHQQLQGKKYFIVLDDVWETEHWEYFKTAFPNDHDKASRLLLTTRNKVIAKYGEYVHEMKALDSHKSWELFLNKAFIGTPNYGTYLEKMESIGRQILEKCHGLPLAISVVGGLLVETQTKSGWEQVLNQINSCLVRAESSVSTILELSYLNLSPQLKSCFLCLAFFKEDSTIPAKRLVDIWVGQGLIQHEGNSTVDEIAKGYLNELINRNMVQSEDLIMDDRVENCSLHDLLREVCLRKAKEEIGLEIVKGEEGVSVSSSESFYKRPRHRVVYGKNLNTSSSNQNKYLRSLFLLNVNGDVNVYMNTPSHYWKSYQLLKTLDLDGFAFRELPRSFRLLIGLKCLRIHKLHNIFRDVMELPSWLNSLTNLEVLCIDNQFVEFPNVALKMEKLRHFHVHSVYGRPMLAENWKNIESMKLIRLEDWVECSSSLRRIRELGIYMNWSEGNDEMKASIEKMTNLAELHLEFNPLSLMNSKLISHVNSVTKLKLDGGMLERLHSNEFPPNLSHLTLEYGKKLIEDPMPELGKLLKLQYLKLSRRRRISQEEEWRMKIMVEGFPRLEALSLQNMQELMGMDVEEGGMPQLKQLRIHNCPNLETKNLPKHIIFISAA